MKLNKPQIISASDSGFFTSRTISLWNSLPGDTVTAPTASYFKSTLDSLSFIVGSLFLISTSFSVLFYCIFKRNDFLGVC